ncbi:MAG TPA: DUF3311 domain-containing protein [Chloroflexota bacterium]|jgi:hypothetical protein|nr:DUF3311 domain-containing protein [Chloroflexota bacterium]
MQDDTVNGRADRRGWLWLLLIPFVALLWPAFYSSVQPTLGGIPFFYWYQFLWIIIAAILTAVVYAMVG